MSPQERKVRLAAVRRQLVAMSIMMLDKLSARVYTLPDDKLRKLELKARRMKPALRQRVEQDIQLARHEAIPTLSRPPAAQ